jgi:glycosyltransferase involved in cell wall biosynthesis
MPRASVILATYNRPYFLQLTLKTYFYQMQKDFELIVADDGSDEKTKQVIDKLKKDAPFLIKHVWQEDRGFRKAKILNKAVLSSESNYLIFSDDDCLPERNFVKLHCQYLRNNMLVLGSVKRISKSITQHFIKHGINVDYEQMLKISEAKLALLKIKEARHNLLGNFQKFFSWPFPERKPKLWGANFSVCKKIFFKVNGFDNNYSNFGGEDTDLNVRLRMLGVTPICCYSKIIVHHLFHEKSAHVVKEYRNLYENYHEKRKRSVISKNGLRQELSAPLFSTRT